MGSLQEAQSYVENSMNVQSVVSGFTAVAVYWKQECLLF